MANEDKPDFNIEFSSIWSFPERGKWATHKSDYRGNFAPQVARNLILTYSKENDLILDPAVGSGTTLIEAKLLNRNAIGIDINQKAIELTKERLDFKSNNESKQTTYLGDFKNLNFIDDVSIDLIIFHPPYFNLIKYSDGKKHDDLSLINDIEKYLVELEKGVNELFVF